MRLMATGSRRLIPRLAYNTTLLWRFPLPSYFPSCSFSFTYLKSLNVKADDRNGFVSVHGRNLLPLEPMSSLTSLDFAFSNSHLVFAPASSHRGMTLASAFPKRTSLAIKSDTSCPLPTDWTESLPQGLFSLTLDIYPSEDFDDSVTPSTFDNLPLGLQHIEFGPLCRIGQGKINLFRFPDLRVLRMRALSSWDVLDSLPDSLEVIALECHGESAAMTTFPISKFPPKIRQLSLKGSDLELSFDTMAPATLEKFVSTHISMRRTSKTFSTRKILRRW